MFADSVESVSMPFKTHPLTNSRGFRLVEFLMAGLFSFLSSLDTVLVGAGTSFIFHASVPGTEGYFNQAQTFPALVS